MLNKIYTVEATYFMRKTASLFEFGRLNKLFERKIEHIDKYFFLDADSANSLTFQKSPSTTYSTTSPTNSCLSFRKKPKRNL